MKKINTYNLDEFLGNSCGVKKANPKRLIIYDLIYIALWNGNIIEMEQRLVIDK